MKIIPNGTEVLIYKYVREWNKQDDENYIVGIVQSSKTSDDLSYHGSPWYEQIYEVLGEDGNIQRGNYGSGWIGNSFFRTKKDHISILKSRITNNQQEILKLQEKNDRYFREISKLEDESKQQPDKNSITLFAAGHSYSWEIFEEKVMNEKYQILEDFFTTTEDRGNSFLYHLIELARECEDKINFVRFVYLLSRMEPTKSQAHSEEWEAYQRFSKSMYLWIQNEDDRRQMITAIYIYVYKNRKKVEE